MAAFQSLSATKTGTPNQGEIVEIGLLLPAKRADALVELARRRHQSVAQVIRGLIDRALSDDELATRWS